MKSTSLEARFAEIEAEHLAVAQFNEVVSALEALYSAALGQRAVQDLALPIRVREFLSTEDGGRELERWSLYFGERVRSMLAIQGQLVINPHVAIPELNRLTQSVSEILGAFEASIVSLIEAR